MPVKPIPDGYHSATPYLMIDGAAKAIEFYQQAFGAEELFRMDDGAGKVGHAEIKIGDSRIMVADEYPQMGFKGPKSYGGTSVGILLYVADVDAVFKRAIAAGASVHQPVADKFYGDRTGTLIDPFGHMWSIATHKEDLTHAEIERRGAEMLKKPKKS